MKRRLNHHITNPCWPYNRPCGTIETGVNTKGTKIQSNPDIIEGKIIQGFLLPIFFKPNLSESIPYINFTPKGRRTIDITEETWPASNVVINCNKYIGIIIVKNDCVMP